MRRFLLFSIFILSVSAGRSQIKEPALDQIPLQNPGHDQQSLSGIPNVPLHVNRSIPSTQDLNATGTEVSDTTVVRAPSPLAAPVAKPGSKKQKIRFRISSNADRSVPGLRNQPSGSVMDAAEGRIIVIIPPLTGIGAKPVPNRLAATLYCYPHPVIDYSKIYFSLPRPAHAVLAIYDGFGRKVKELVGSQNGEGEHSVLLNRGNLSRGLYYCRLTADSEVKVLKIMIE
jgi:hypothetical protein